MDANKNWLSIPKDVRNSLLNNVWCGHCSDVTTIASYIIENHEFGMVLKGNCKKCSNKVARVIEAD